MPRHPRIDIPGAPQHLVVRGNNRSLCFFADADRRLYLDYLRAAIAEFDCELHAYVLMTNHVHLLATGRAPGALSQVMHSSGTRYARYVNARHGRTGSLFEGRFKSSLIETERYLMTCMRYIELNPVRAGMVGGPGEYLWSSHRANASGAPSGLLTPHELYLRLGSSALGRGGAYRALFDEAMPQVEIDAIRASIAKCRAFGSEAFCRTLSEELDRDIGVTPQGRPIKRKGTG